MRVIEMRRRRSDVHWENMAAGDFAWHATRGGARRIRLCLPVLSDLRAIGWKNPPSRWVETIPVVRTPPPAGMVVCPITPFAPAVGPWLWDGNLATPTLTPSVHTRTGAPGACEATTTVWHGFISGGVLKAT